MAHSLGSSFAESSSELGARYGGGRLPSTLAQTLWHKGYQRGALMEGHSGECEWTNWASYDMVGLWGPHCSGPEINPIKQYAIGFVSILTYDGFLSLLVKVEP
jgi:hypothetical protein